MLHLKLGCDGRVGVKCRKCRHLEMLLPRLPLMGLGCSLRLLRRVLRLEPLDLFPAGYLSLYPGCHEFLLTLLIVVLVVR